MTHDVRARLLAYRAGYAPGGPVAGDAGVRAADAYVVAGDPLRGCVGHPAWPGLSADVAIGVEPGTYFCGGLAHALAGLRGSVRVGFIHVPPEAALARAASLDLTGLVVAGVLAALDAAAPCRRVLVTGFGPFPGVADNPTEAFAGDAARVAAATGGRGVGTVLRLADGTGTPFTAMAPVREQLLAVLSAPGGFDVVLALGVDSRQALARPRFTIESQSRGMAETGPDGARGPAPVAAPLDDVALAVLGAKAFAPLPRPAS